MLRVCYAVFSLLTSIAYRRSGYPQVRFLDVMCVF